MTQHSDVHKFGNGETHENVPNTAYSDKAMKGKMINPNDPQENLDLFSGDNDTPPVKALPFRTNVEPEIQNGQGVIRPEHERQSSSEDGYLRQQTVTASHHDPACSRNTTNQQLSDGVSSGGPEPGIEHSPLHIHYQAKAGGRERSAVSSPSWERKPSSNNGVDRYTAGRSTTRGDESPEKAAAVPKFGEWDVNDPSSVDGFTHIFNKLREEKHLKHGGIATTTTTTSCNDNSEIMENQRKVIIPVSFKNLLNEILQKFQLPPAEYDTKKENSDKFETSLRLRGVNVFGPVWFVGASFARKIDTEQDAARKAIRFLKTKYEFEVEDFNLGDKEFYEDYYGISEIENRKLEEKVKALEERVKELEVALSEFYISIDDENEENSN